MVGDYQYLGQPKDPGGCLVPPGGETYATKVDPRGRAGEICMRKHTKPTSRG